MVLHADDANHAIRKTIQNGGNKMLGKLGLARFALAAFKLPISIDVLSERDRSIQLRGRFELQR